MIQGLDHINTFLSEVQTFARTGKKLVYFYGPDAILLELAEYPARSAAEQAES